MGEGKRRCCKPEDAGEGEDFPTGMTVGGGRRQSICQLVWHRLQIVTSYTATSFKGPLS